MRRRLPGDGCSGSSCGLCSSELREKAQEGRGFLVTARAILPPLRYVLPSPGCLILAPVIWEEPQVSGAKSEVLPGPQRLLPSGNFIFCFQASATQLPYLGCKWPALPFFLR